MVFETYLIAEKAVHKVLWIGRGSFFFRLSLAPLQVFLVFAFVRDGWIGTGLALLLVSALVALMKSAGLSAPKGGQEDDWTRLTRALGALTHLRVERKAWGVSLIADGLVLAFGLTGVLAALLILVWAW